MLSINTQQYDSYRQTCSRAFSFLRSPISAPCVDSLSGTVNLLRGHAACACAGDLAGDTMTCDSRATNTIQVTILRLGIYAASHPRTLGTQHPRTN